MPFDGTELANRPCIQTTQPPSYKKFDDAMYAWKSSIDYRRYPTRYRVGRGEQGVLICEPYKSELLSLWRFKTPGYASTSAAAISQKFEEYLAIDDFVGADMARKFLQMGFTRARRYANYKGGRKYEGEDHHLLKRGTGDPQKAISAEIFYNAWRAAEANEAYAAKKADWKERLG